MSGSWCIKGTDESMNRMGSSVPLMHHDPDRSRITDPDPDHPKGMQSLPSWYLFPPRCINLILGVALKWTTFPSRLGWGRVQILQVDLTANRARSIFDTKKHFIEFPLYSGSRTREVSSELCNYLILTARSIKSNTSWSK